MIICPFILLLMCCFLLITREASTLIGLMNLLHKLYINIAIANILKLPKNFCDIPSIIFQMPGCLLN